MNSKFINKLKEIKRDTFHFSELNLLDLIEVYNFSNKNDKNFILGNNSFKNYIGDYKSDIYEIIKTLLEESKKLTDDNRKEIIENYKKKYIENSFDRDYCLTYIELLSKKIKSYDILSIYKELYNSYNNDSLNYRFNILFQNYNEIEYFIESFKKYLDIKEEYGFKYLDKSSIKYLTNLDNEIFSRFVLSLSSYNLIFFKGLKETQIKIFIKKINDIDSSDINNQIKKLFLEITKNLVKRENYSKNYDYISLLKSFIKSNFADKLSVYLGKIYTDLSIELLQEIKGLFFAYWDIVKILSNIIKIENITKICKISGVHYYDVYIYELIELGTRKDKKELLDKFKESEGFDKKLKNRQEELEKSKSDTEERKKKEKDKFNKNIKKIIENEETKPKGINEWFLYQFENNKDKNFKQKKDVIDVVKKQIKRFFKLDSSNPEAYKLNYTKKFETSSSYTTHQFVVNRTFLRCLKFYKEFGFKISDDIRKKAINYVPFAYSGELNVITSIIGDEDLKKSEVNYLLSIYDGSRIKDDLRYSNIQTFIYFYDKYKKSFLKYGEDKLKETLFNIVNNNEYKGYERTYTAEKFVEIGEEKQLLELFNKYKSDKNYFLDTLSKSLNDKDNQEFKIAILSSKYLLKRFPKLNKKRDLVNWYINQLKVKIEFLEPPHGRMRGVSSLESEIMGRFDKEDKFIVAFKFINDLSFEKEIKNLLNYSFKIKQESKNYEIFGNYIQKAVFYFYKGIKNKKLKTIFELEKYLNNLKIKSEENRILFKVAFLDKLINIYSESISKLEINKIYKSVYREGITKSKEINLLEKKVDFLTNKQYEIFKPLIITEGKTDWRYFLKALDYFHNKREFKLIKTDFFYKYGDIEDHENGTCGTEFNLTMGDTELGKYLKNLKHIREKDFLIPKPIRIGIFDSDNPAIKTVNSKDNFVFSFKIKPDDISSEFLFSEKEIKTTIEIKKKERRLYIGDEFSSKSKKLILDPTINVGGGNSSLNKCGKKIIIDSDVYDCKSENIALSKGLFSQKIYEGKIKIGFTSWEKFRHIFKSIEKIIKDSK